MLRFTIDAGAPISHQIYSQIKNMILDGTLSPGERLPASRQLGKELKLSRNTVLAAYDWLIAEGYAMTNTTAGIYVSDQEFPKYGIKTKQTNLLEEISPRSSHIISFETGIPALDLVPKQKLGSISKSIFTDAEPGIFNYDFAEGRPELRNEICKYLKRTRNINCTPKEIMITSGTKQSMTLIAKCLLGAGSTVVIEDPSFAHIRRIFGFHCQNFYPVPADKEGIVPALLPRDIRPDMIFTTPSHQIPIGGILPLGRRLKLLKYAREKHCCIVEDDYDSEFNYDNRFIPTIKELDGNNKSVIYAGTFSKVLYPSLRVGYLLLPETLMERFKEVKALGDAHTNTINQLVLARYMEEGRLSRHVLKMKRVYKRRRDYIIRSIREIFGDGVEVFGYGAGMHVVARFKDITFTDELIKKIRKNGVVLSPDIEGAAHIKGQHLGEIPLGYTNLTEEQITKGLKILKRVFA